VDQQRLRAMNEEIDRLIAQRGERTAVDLLPQVDAIMRRYGVSEPSTEGLIQWIDKAIASPPG
jgi:hypothetical protein